MGKIKYGDIVVSMIGQLTYDDYCWIDAGFVSEARTNENGEESSQVIWFNETTSGYGNYPAKNFRLATDKEAKEYREIGAYTINTEEYKYSLNDRVGTAYGMGQIIALKEGFYSKHCNYLVSLDHAPSYAHNGGGDSILIGQYGEKNNCVWLSEGNISYNNGLPPTTPVTGTYSSSIGYSGSPSTGSVNVMSGTGSYVGSTMAGLNGDCTTAGLPPFQTTIYEVHKEAHKEAMARIEVQLAQIEALQSTLSSKEDVKHQDAIILKSKINKRKLITV